MNPKCPIPSQDTHNRAVPLPRPSNADCFYSQPCVRRVAGVMFGACDCLQRAAPKVMEGVYGCMRGKTHFWVNMPIAIVAQPILCATPCPS